MFDRRNIEIESGQLSIGLDNLFDNIEESKKIFFYVKYPEIIQMFHNKKTNICIQINAEDLDVLAKNWIEKRKLND